MTNSAVTTATYTISPPTITSVSPTSGAAGMQVTISGSDFGSAQGTGAVWLGSTLGTVVSWSDTQVVATVASNATSGTARVRQGGAWSNAVPFNVNTATISTVTPVERRARNPGDHHGLRLRRGPGQRPSVAWHRDWRGTKLERYPNCRSGGQLDRPPATRSVLQNGVMSNAVPFAVNTLHITSVSPVSGGSGTSVTITGTGFGASQGSGMVLLGSTDWPGCQLERHAGGRHGSLHALTGVARIQQNGVWSNALELHRAGGETA